MMITMNSRTEIVNNEEEKKWPQILAIFCGTLICIVSGILFSWPSPFILKITQDENYNISESQASWFTVLHPMGMFIVSPFCVPIPNIIGRKRTLLLAAVPLVTSLIIKAFATNLWLLYFTRFLAGGGDAMVFSALPAYIGEVASPEVRGVWGNAFTVCLFFGQFLVNVVGSYCKVQATSAILMSFPILFLITFSFMPESPYYYTLVGKYDDAKKSLRQLKRRFDVEKEFQAIKEAVEQQQKVSSSWIDLVATKTNRRALTASLFLRMSQPLSGVYVFASYTQFIFEKAGGVINAQTSAMMQTGLTMFMYACASYGSNMLGRRKAYMLSIFFSGLVLYGEAAFFYLDANVPGVSLESVTWIPLAGMLVFVVISSFGVGIIPSLMTTELFSTAVKGPGVSVSTMAFALTSLLVLYGFYYINELTGLYGPFLLFASFNMISTVITYFVVPETKGKTLEEIQEALRNM